MRKGRYRFPNHCELTLENSGHFPIGKPAAPDRDMHCIACFLAKVAAEADYSASANHSSITVESREKSELPSYRANIQGGVFFFFIIIFKTYFLLMWCAYFAATFFIGRKYKPARLQRQRFPNRLTDNSCSEQERVVLNFIASVFTSSWPT